MFYLISRQQKMIQFKDTQLQNKIWSENCHSYDFNFCKSRLIRKNLPLLGFIAFLMCNTTSALSLKGIQNLNGLLLCNLELNCLLSFKIVGLHDCQLIFFCFTESKKYMEEIKLLQSLAFFSEIVLFLAN